MSSCGAEGCNREMIWDEDSEVEWCREHGTHEDVMDACEDCNRCYNCENGEVQNGKYSWVMCRECFGDQWIPCDLHCHSSPL